MILTKDGGWWKFNGRLFWVRDTPNWKELHPLGPVHFDIGCPECDFVLNDLRDTESDAMRDHFCLSHIFPRIVLEHMRKNGIVNGSGEGI